METREQPALAYIPSDLVLASQFDEYQAYSDLFLLALDALIKDGVSQRTIVSVLRPFASDKAATILDAVANGRAKDMDAVRIVEMGLSAYRSPVAGLTSALEALSKLATAHFPDNDEYPTRGRVAALLLQAMSEALRFASFPLNPNPFAAATWFFGLSSLSVQIGHWSSFLRSWERGDFELIAAGRKATQPPIRGSQLTPAKRAEFDKWWDETKALSEPPTTRQCEAWGASNGVARKRVRELRSKRPDRRGPGASQSR